MGDRKFVPAVKSLDIIMRRINRIHWIQCIGRICVASSIRDGDRICRLYYRLTAIYIGSQILASDHKQSGQSANCKKRTSCIHQNFQRRLAIGINSLNDMVAPSALNKKHGRVSIPMERGIVAKS